MILTVLILLTIISTEVAMNVDVNSVSANVIVSNSESEIDCTDPVDRASSDHISTNGLVTAEQILRDTLLVISSLFIMFMVMVIALTMQYCTN